MLLFDRRRFLTLSSSTVLLGACGFTPVYQEGTAASTLQGQIDVGLVTGRNGFELREQLVDRLGRAGTDAPYLLVYDLSVSTSGIATSETEGTTRYNLTGTADFKVQKTDTNEVVFSDSVRNFTAYSATSATYPTTTAAIDANVRLSKALADQIVARIATTAPGWHT